MDWLDLLAVQGTLKSLLQHHSSKASILQHAAFFIVQLPHPYMTTRKTIALTRWTFVGKVMSLLFNMLSRLVITFLPRSKHLVIHGCCVWPLSVTVRKPVSDLWSWPEHPIFPTYTGKLFDSKIVTFGYDLYRQNFYLAFVALKIYAENSNT